MSYAAILILAVGLALDATAVAAAQGLSARRIDAKGVLRLAGLFGGFQALMPFIGWLVGNQVGPFVARWANWIAFGLLSILGAKMLHEAFTQDDEAEQRGAPFSWTLLLPLAVATSIDALAAGFTLPLLHAPLLVSLATIGIVTAVLSAAGVFLGRLFGARLGKRLDATGGIVLIALGLKILLDH
ncbi:MAG TPA: manganese efflux pump MntP family protein [Polyangiaceae bacterium]|jgi:putative Mn2+ efflux pump MntP|nr:manganese efflux pump MntP family protein [Polyangiaceae bacterium]